MKIKIGDLDFFEKKIRIAKKNNPVEIFEKLREKKINFLFESDSSNPIYGRMSLAGINPILKISGKKNIAEIEILSNRGKIFFDQFIKKTKKFSEFILKKTSQKIIFKIEKSKQFLPELQRTRRKNIAQILREFLEIFPASRSTIFGIFGAMSYDFSRLFEDLPEILPERKIPDFQFFVFDSFLKFDLLKNKSEIIVFRSSKNEAEKAAEEILKKISTKIIKKKINCPKISGIICDTKKSEFEKLVSRGKKLATHGEIFQIVFSRKIFGQFSGDPFQIYKIYRQKNPSPYLFFFDFGQNQLVGASPEMMVRVENGIVNLRPIAGSAARGNDPITDHENMLQLLQSEKERAELDMLVDLGRNDLARVCKPGIKISDYRSVEKYSKIMHTISHLTGKLQKQFSAFDAVVACQPAGTLSGAPKIAAMTEIEKSEKSRRGFYGGTIGYFSFSGSVDTGIIIRSAHFTKNKFEFRVGAGIVFDSDPSSEFKETEKKSAALLEILY